MSHDLSALAAPLATVPREHVHELINDAPVGTLIMIDDEVHRRFSNGDWRNLESLVSDGNSYYGGDTWESWSVESLLAYLGNEHCSSVVQLVRWGE